MTNKKFKMAAMSLALTACVATAPLAANAEAPEENPGAGVPAATEHAETPEAGAPVEEVPVEEETPVEEAPEEEEASKEETPKEKKEAPSENAVVEKEAPAEETPVVLASAPAAAPAPAAAKEDADILMEDPDAAIAAEDPDADIATMDGAEKEVSTDEATIDGTSYGTLQGAIDSAKEGQTVVLNKNTSGSINIAKWIKLNLNDHTINGDVKVDLSGKKGDTATSQDGETTDDKKVEIVHGTIIGAKDSGVTIKNAGDTNVLLKDLTIEKNEGKQGGGVHIENSRNVTIDHCTIQDNKTTEVSKNGSDVSVGAGGGVFVSDKSRVTIQNGSTIQGNTGTRGGGIYVDNSTVEVEDSTIDNNTANDVPSDAPTSNLGQGGGIYTTDSTVHVSNSTIQKNTANGALSGGGILGSHSTVVVNKSTITENTAAEHPNADGGGIAVTKDSSLTVTGGSKITANSAVDCGGGIYAKDSSLDVKDSFIDGNTAHYGGGLYVSDENVSGEAASKLIHTVTNTEITNNTAKGTSGDFGMGGGIYVGTQNLTITGSKVSGNKATGAGSWGGGICVYNVGFDVTLDNVQVENNTSHSKGGGVFAYNIAAKPSKLTLKNGTTIKGNTAASGGGIYALGPMTILAEKTDVLNNSATGWAGGVFAYNGVTIKANNTKFLNNSAAAAGGILLWSNSSATLDNSEVSGNKATGDAGGVYVYDYTCSLTTSNGTVFRENSANNGGGISSEGGTVTAEDSTFEKNTAVKCGGAIAATQDSSLTVRNSKVLKNTSGDKAGGILAEESTLEVTDSIIDGNRASEGGGLYIGDVDAPGETKEDKPEHTITHTEITNNTADGQGIGGGIYLGAQKLTITDSNLTGNNTISNDGQTEGGAIIAHSPGDLTLDNTLIQGNTADVGGGIHVLSINARDSHIILCNNTRITGNVANQFGGGIFLDDLNNPAVLELVNASVDNNTAAIAGGIGNNGSIVILKDGAVLENNTAKQFAGGLYNAGKVTVESGATVMNNTASTYGGGLYNKGEAIVESGAKLYNNHAALAGDDIYLVGKNSTLTLTKVGDDWMLDDCGHKINGWFADLLDARWDADGKQEHVINLKDYAADGLIIVENNKDGSFTITVLDENATLALKAAHNVIPTPTPDPDPEGPETPVTPEKPGKPEAPATPEKPEKPETPVETKVPQEPGDAPASPAAPNDTAVHDTTVAALPKTGVNWMMALAMALSGMALMAAGAFTSLFYKSKH